MGECAASGAATVSRELPSGQKNLLAYGGEQKANAVTPLSAEACASALSNALTSASVRYQAAESLDDIALDLFQRAVDAVIPDASPP